MPIRGAENAVRQMTRILQANLPTELNLIDVEEGSDFILDDVDNAAYLEFEGESADLSGYTIAISLDARATEPLEVKSTLNSPGIAHADHEIVVAVHVKDVNNESAAQTKRRVMRYARAIERVLAIKYPTAPSGGEETVVRIRREGSMTYRLNEQQLDGKVARSAVIPFMVTTYEAL